MLKGNKITRRWIRNSFGVIVAIILLASLALSITIRRYYYNQVDQTLENEAFLVTNALQIYARENTGDFNEKVRNYVTNFDKREQMELMIISSNGQTEITSSGFSPEIKAMPDYIAAMDNEDGIGIVVGELSAGEKSMILSQITPIKQRSSNILAIRLATSLTNIDRQVYTIILVIFAVAIITLALVLFSSYYFISSIVMPIGKVGETARKIAQGDFGARLNIKHDDEIGELAEIINYMADELDNSEKMKNDFISSVSHELRTPLTAIQGWSETIKLDSGEDKELLDKGMDIVISETHRLSDMVEDLLDFSRMQSGRLKLVKASIDPLKELEEAVEMYTPRGIRDGIDLKYIQSTENVLVYADKNRLRQVFINVIDNAIKYSDKGDSVRVRAFTENQNIVIKVEDTGIGISEIDLPNVTNKFYKADSTRRGSGIGLAVASDIITSHNGMLLVESEQGVGTTITISIPIYTGEGNLSVENIS